MKDSLAATVLLPMRRDPRRAALFLDVTRKHRHLILGGTVRQLFVVFAQTVHVSVRERLYF